MQNANIVPTIEMGIAYIPKEKGTFFQFVLQIQYATGSSTVLTFLLKGIPASIPW